MIEKVIQAEKIEGPFLAKTKEGQYFITYEVDGRKRRVFEIGDFELIDGLFMVYISKYKYGKKT